MTCGRWLACGVLLIATACSGATSVEDTTVPTTTVPDTTTPAILPGEDDAPTGVPLVLEPPDDPVDWIPAELGRGATLPCCAEQWLLGTSPDLPAPAGQLEDGVYTYEIENWSPSWEPVARIRVQSFVSCDLADEIAGLRCEPPVDPDSVSIDPRYAIEQPFTIDEELVVGYTGPGDCDTGAGGQYVTTGAGYAEMIQEFSADYNEWIGPLANAPSNWGVTDEAILDHLASLDTPFVVDPCGMSGGMTLLWTSSRGVPVLMQTIRSSRHVGALDVSELTFPTTLHVENGRMMIYVGGYFRS